jgi:hypothetical protein
VWGVNLSENEDVVRWEFERDGKFSTKSTYRFIQNPWVRDSRMMDMWSINCPLKHIFLFVVVLEIRSSPLCS